MAEWVPYGDGVERHTVVGNLLRYPSLFSPQLDNHREILTWLPPSYAEHSERRYPVIYLHDGQNLFDAHTSYVGEWRVDETLTALSGEGYEAIVVGIPNQGEARSSEYNPYPPGRGEAYLRFIVETVKPLIDAHFRTQPEASMTGIGGSSMGGLISLYGFLQSRDVFGFCLCMSPAFWYGDGALSVGVNDYAKFQAERQTRIYLDVGMAEGGVLAELAPRLALTPEMGDLAYVRGVRELRDALVGAGYQLDETLRYVEEEQAPHNESAWARRLPDALRFLLPRL